MKNHFSRNFILCGLIGWCWECFWTGIGSVFQGRKDKTFLCKTSLWMFPIYGLAAFIGPVFQWIRKFSVGVRGCIYTIGIFLTELFTGSLLKQFHACPWDYSKAKLNVKGVIRLDYAPFWFILSLLYERLLTKQNNA